MKRPNFIVFLAVILGNRWAARQAVISDALSTYSESFLRTITNKPLKRSLFRCLPRCISILTIAALAATRYPCGAQNGESVTIRIDPQTVVSQISPDFIGLGYETCAVAQTNYFNAANTTLVRLYRNLSPHGLIRIGGNISDHTRYVPDGTPAVRTEKEVTIINRSNLADLAGFARATGWKVMWGLNLGTGTPEDAAEEALAVESALQDRLHSFQIGNEVDLRSGYQNRYDSYQSYYSNFLSYRAAVRAVLPNATFSGPDVAGNLGWLRRFADTEARNIKLLTHHYYRTGAHRPDATIETLLQGDENWKRRLAQLQQIAKSNHVPFRINEVNSFYGGGKAGVSDTFASALWSLDYMYELASYGCNGINLETDINQLGWISHYSPIVHDPDGTCHVRPEYYGMLAFAMGGQGDLLKLNLTQGDLNLTAYAARSDRGTIWLTVVNKDLSRDAELEAVLPAGFAVAEAFRLSAPLAESQDRVTFAGAEVAADGRWAPGPAKRVAVKASSAHLMVPHASAVLVRLRQ